MPFDSDPAIGGHLAAHFLSKLLEQREKLHCMGMDKEEEGVRSLLTRCAIPDVLHIICDMYLADPGEDRGCSTNSLVID